VRRRTRNKRVQTDDDYEGHGWSRVAVSLQLLVRLVLSHGGHGVASAGIGMYIYERLENSCGWKRQDEWRLRSIVC
jgi:hypothetical protein